MITNKWGEEACLVSRQGNYILDALGVEAEPSSRVINLLELMKRFHFGGFYESANFLGSISSLISTLGDVASKEQPAEGLIDRVKDWIKNAIQSCEAPSLNLSKKLLTDFSKRLESNPELITNSILQNFFETYAGRVKDELSLHSFYQIQSDRVKYYDGARSMFGATVASAFPSALDDIDEAGKCLAVGRSSACVFHLMRSLEPVLKAISDELEISKHSPAWNAYLTAFDAAINTKFSSKNSKDVAEKKFFKDIEAHLFTVKDAWRNPTIHDIAAVYTEEQAEGIFNAVKSLMQKISEKVKEKP